MQVTVTLDNEQEEFVSKAATLYGSPGKAILAALDATRKRVEVDEPGVYLSRFLYLLARDHLTVGTMEALLELSFGPLPLTPTKWLIDYAKSCATQLRKR